MIGEAMLALGNAELVGAEDTLSLRKIKKKGEENIGTRWCNIWQRSWQSVQRTEENRKRICYILLRFASIDAIEKWRSHFEFVRRTKQDCLSKIWVSFKRTKMGDRQSHADLKPFLAKRIDRHSSVTASVRERGQIEVTLLLVGLEWLKIWMELFLYVS